MAPVPRVSILMGVYNCADTLDEALESIEAQTYTDWELVICDDGSTDETPEVLAAWQRRLEGRITVLRNAQNSRLSFTLNRCIAEARGELFARMDGDDVSVPERLEKQVSVLDERGEIDLVGTWMRRFDERGTADVVSVPERPEPSAFRRGVPFCHATVVVRREVFERIGDYSLSSRAVRNEDLDLWFRFFEAGLVGVNLPEPLYLVREDLAAIRRRTVAGRWNVLLTTIHGYRALQLPWRWYAGPVGSFLKAFVPAGAAAQYRRFQRRQSTRAGVS